MSETETTPPTLEALDAEVAEKEREAETLTETLREMAQLRHRGRLPRERYADYLF
jgi:hypothetical protein